MKRLLKLALLATVGAWLAKPIAAQQTPIAASDDNLIQYVSNGDAKVGIWIPQDWKVHVWNLGLDDGSLSHVMDVDSGRQVVVHMRECSPDRRNAWTRGEEAEKQLGYRTETIAPADPETASLFPDAASFVTVADRDSTVYKSRAYFMSEHERCYLVEFVSVLEDFEPSRAEFEQVAVRFVE